MRFTPGSWLRQYLRKVKRRGLNPLLCYLWSALSTADEGNGVGVVAWLLGSWLYSDPGDAKSGPARSDVPGMS